MPIACRLIEQSRRYPLVNEDAEKNCKVYNGALRWLASTPAANESCFLRFEDIDKLIINDLCMLSKDGTWAVRSVKKMPFCKHKYLQ